MKKALSILLSLLLVFGTTAFALTAAAEEPTIIDQGYCGVGDNRENVWYTLDSDGLLKIDGEGALGSGSWSGYFAPYTHSVKKVIIEDGITSIGGYVFQGSPLYTITVPASVTEIGYRAFYEAINLHVFAYQGTPEQWENVSIDKEWNGVVYTAYNNYTAGHEDVTFVLNDEESYAATCKRGGCNEYTVYCNKGHQCNSLTISTPIDPTNHVHTTDFPATEATEAAHGYTAGVYCNDCETWISGHDVIHNALGEQRVIQEPTETEEGIVDIRCTVCGEWGRYTVSATGPTNDEPGGFWAQITGFFRGIIDWFLRLFHWFG